MQKKFDAVRFMREAREQIDQEDRALSWEERSKKTRKLLSKSPLWKRLRTRVAPATSERFSRKQQASS